MSAKLFEDSNPWQSRHSRSDYYIRKPVDNRLKRDVKSPYKPGMLEISDKAVARYNRNVRKKANREKEYKAAVKEYEQRTKLADTSNLPNYHAQQVAISRVEANRAKMGPAPWEAGYEGFKRLNKRDLKKAGVFQTMHGYMQSLGGEWDAKNKPEEKYVTLASGKKAKVIDSHLGVPLGYQGASDIGYDENGMSSLEYVAKVFDGNHKTYKTEGCGHIADMEYSAYYQLLKVHFVKGDTIVVYFRVPTAVFGELYHLAQSKVETSNTVDGTVRHMLGVKFWDLVRIRGTLHGSRYRFEYIQDYTPTGDLPGRRTGWSHKYDYMTVPKQRSEGETVVRIPVENRQEAQNKQILSTWGIDELDEYFDNNGRFGQHLATTKDKSALWYIKEAKRLYDEGADAEDIIENLHDAVESDPTLKF